MKGRKPKLALLEGGADPDGCPGPPDWLPEHAAAEWRRVAPELHARRLLARDTQAMLESYCVAIGTVRECEELMRAEGRVVAGAAGPVAHPATRIQVSAMREARLLACELGLSPHRRGKHAEEPQADPWQGMVG